MSNRNPTFVALTLALLGITPLALLHCGSDGASADGGDGDGDGDSGLEVEENCKRYIDAQCDFLSDCFGLDEEDCLESGYESCSEATDASREEVDRCVEDLQEIECDDTMPRACVEAVTFPDGAGGSGGGDGTGGGGGGDGSGGNDGCADDEPYTTVQPEGRPAGAGPGDGGGVLLAVSRWYLGEVDRSGAASISAWQEYGYDVDHVNTVDGEDEGGAFDGNDLACSCAPVGGEVNAGNLEDGPGGLDNSWGKNVLPFFSSIFEDPSEGASEVAEEGTATVAFFLSNVGTGSSYDPVTSSYYHLREGESGTWRSAPESLNGNDPASPRTVLPTAYVSTNTWVSAPIAALDVPISVGGLPLPFIIHDAVVSMELSPDRTAATGGVISGTLDTEEFITAFTEAMARIAGDTEGLCPGDQLLESILQNIRAASDIMANGTQVDGATCTGITIALGFDALAVQASGVAAPLDPEPSPCD